MSRIWLDVLAHREELFNTDPPRWWADPPYKYEFLDNGHIRQTAEGKAKISASLKPISAADPLNLDGRKIYRVHVRVTLDGPEEECQI